MYTVYDLGRFSSVVLTDGLKTNEPQLHPDLVNFLSLPSDPEAKNWKFSCAGFTLQIKEGSAVWEHVLAVRGLGEDPMAERPPGCGLGA